MSTAKKAHCSEWPADASQVAHCPYPLFASWRHHRQIFFAPEIESYVVTRYDTILQILRQPQKFSSCGAANPPMSAVPGFSEFAEKASAIGGTLAEFVALTLRGRKHYLLTADGAEHARLRRAIADHFSPAATALLEPDIQAILDELFHQLAAEGEFDLAAHFGQELPLRVIARLLKIPKEKSTEFIQIVNAMSLDIFGLDPAEACRATDGESAIRRFFEEYVEGADPALSGLRAGLKHQIEAGFLTLQEATHLCQDIIAAGVEPVRSLLNSALLLILSTPGLLSALRADNRKIEPFINELLRMHPPVNGFWRRATADVELDGLAIPAGAALFLVYASGSRDERYFVAPDVMRLDRPVTPQHLAFGHGAHFCIGSSIARTEIKLAVQLLVNSFERLQLKQHPSEIAYVPDLIMHSPICLHLTYTKCSHLREPHRQQGPGCS